MERPLLIYPGDTGPLVALQDFLRDWHADVASERLQEIAQSKLSVAPLVDADAAEVGRLLSEAAAALHGPDGLVAAKALAAKAAESVKLIEPLSPYKDDPAIDGISVRFRVMDERTRSSIQRDIYAAVSRWRKSIDGSGDAFGDVEATQAVSDLRLKMVAAGVAEVRGFFEPSGLPIVMGGEQGLTARDLGALQAIGLHVILSDAAAAFQALPAKKGVRFGQRAAYALSASSVRGAQSMPGPISDATAAPWLPTADRPTSQAHDTSRTPALVVK